MANPKVYERIASKYDPATQIRERIAASKEDNEVPQESVEFRESIPAEKSRDYSGNTPETLSQNIFDSYTPEALSFILAKNKIWTYFTDPPLLDKIGIWYESEEGKKLGYKKRTELRSIGVHNKLFCKRERRERNSFDLWMEFPLRNDAKRVGFYPGKAEREIPDVVNTWQECKYSAISHDPSLLTNFLYHMEHIICAGKKERFEFLKTWIANTIQFPLERSGIAIILVGAPLSGKSIFAAFLKCLHSPHAVEVTRTTNFTGRFNAILDEKTFGYIDNISQIKQEDQEVLKSYVTQDDITIENKGIDVNETRKTYINLMFASNNREGAVLPIDYDDRRMAFFDTADTYSAVKQNPDTDAYYDRLKLDLANPLVLSELHYFFRFGVEVDKTLFRKIPGSPSRINAILAGCDSVRTWLYELLYFGEIPELCVYFAPSNPNTNWLEGKILVGQKDLYRCYENAQIRKRLPVVSSAEFAQVIRNVFAEYVKPSGVNYGFRNRNKKADIDVWTYPLPILRESRRCFAEDRKLPVGLLFSDNLM